MLKLLVKGYWGHKIFAWYQNITLGLLGNYKGKVFFSFPLARSGGANEAFIYKMDIIILPNSEGYCEAQISNHAKHISLNNTVNGSYHNYNKNDNKDDYVLPKGQEKA